MSPTSTDQITLTGSQRRELTRLTRAGRTEQRLVMRAAIVLILEEHQDWNLLVRPHHLPLA